QVSAEVWFKASAFANTIDLVNHVYGGTGGQGWALFVNGSGVLYFGFYQSGGSQQLVGSAPLSTGTTYHAVGTYDGNGMRLYLNGPLVGSKTVGALTLNTTGGVFTGKTDTTGPVSVDELALYPTALSAARVQAHFSAATGGGGGGTPPSNTTPPSISGSAVVGSTMTVVPGTWSGTQPITLTYQWMRC